MVNITFSEVITPLITAITAVFGWFQDFILTGEWGLIITGLVIFFLFSRLILAPLFGSSLSRKSGESDSVRKVDDE